MKGGPVTLLSREIKIGDTAPTVEVANQQLIPVGFSHIKDKVTVLITVPSLDTDVCDIETKRFVKLTEWFGDEVKLVVASMDLPFAQKRWCSANSPNLTMVSDYRKASLGMGYGVLIKEVLLLARAVFVIDKQGVIRYVEYVPDVSSEPDYDKAMTAVKDILTKP